MKIPYLMKRFFELLGYENLHLEKDSISSTFRLSHSKFSMRGDKRIGRYMDCRDYNIDNSLLLYIWADDNKGTAVWAQFNDKSTFEDIIQILVRYSFLNIRDKNDNNKYQFPKDEIELAMLESIFSS